MKADGKLISDLERQISGGDTTQDAVLAALNQLSTEDDKPLSLDSLSHSQAVAGWLLAGGWIKADEVGPGLLEKAIHGWSGHHFFLYTVKVYDRRWSTEEEWFFDYLIERVGELCGDDPEHVRMIGQGLCRLADRLSPKPPHVEAADNSGRMPELLASMEKLKGVDPSHLQAMREHVAYLGREWGQEWGQAE
jgi:hypothetical protein